MNNIFHNEQGSIIGLGNPKAKVHFMLPTAPKIPQQGYNVENIVEENGNHWRKIFVICAKLCTHNMAWQDFREQHLLSSCYLNFGEEINTHANIIFICGKSHLTQLSLESTPSNWLVINDEYKVRVAYNCRRQLLIATPYLDYRQFPNVLIEHVRDYVASIS